MTRYTVVPFVSPVTTRAFSPSTEISAARLRAGGSETYAANETIHPCGVVGACVAGLVAVSTGMRGGTGRGIGARGGFAAVCGVAVCPFAVSGAGLGGGAARRVVSELSRAAAELESANVTG